jgi:hypothetical protein
MTALDLAKLNSATQYPSILTYHAMGERGRLTEVRTAAFEFVDPDDVEVTEKIDGTNARVIIPPAGHGDLLIGSRTELLHYDTDIIANPTLGIVDTVKPWIYDLADLEDNTDWLVVFGEVYGSRVGGAAKNYTCRDEETDFRVFDIARVPAWVLDWDRDKIAAWRDHQGQDFVRTDVLAEAADRLEFGLVPLLTEAGIPPVSVLDTHEWLKTAISATHVALDDTAKGKPEGVIVRTADRAQIAKIRFEDYGRTAKALARA